tara:strand:+ start:3592 stop:4755 length:1164 start_codon:yes stop_codon:yes gene_type:complete
MKFGLDSLQEWKELRRFQKLDEKNRKIVFYLENEYYATYFEKLIKELTNVHGLTICYVTSSKTDPILNSNNDKILAFYVGDGTARTNFFMNLKADILVMTMPDLETFHIKRSKVHNVHYVYAFHSIVSTHMIYRKKAFDSFDTILCVGRHHVDEISKNEKKYGLQPKKLIEFGYGKLDLLMDEVEKNREIKSLEKPNRTILIAPTWCPNGLIETRGDELIQTLLDSDYDVILRPHPITYKKSQKIIKNIEKKFQKNIHFKLELDIRNSNSFFLADCMISDWSGVAMEFAFGLEKPVLYMDLPKKINNQDYESLEIIPLEEKIRTQIGAIISPLELTKMSSKIENLCSNNDQIRKKIQAIRKETVFNLGKSEKYGAKYLLEYLARKNK